ncbi:hypothetical protein ACJX0J_026865, partial [Zea mays]
RPGAAGTFVACLRPFVQISIHCKMTDYKIFTTFISLNKVDIKNIFIMFFHWIMKNITIHMINMLYLIYVWL